MNKEEAKTNRDIGIDQSAIKSGSDWAIYADTFLMDYLVDNRELFVDDLWNAGLIAPESSRALGAVFRRAAKNGWIVQRKIGAYTAARQSVRSNMQLKPVWKSLLYKI